MVVTKPCQLRVEPLEDRCLLSANVVLEWNQLALAAIGQARVSPAVASRVLAITQLAVYDAVNAIDGAYAPYAFSGQAPPGTSPEAAAATAAYHTLVELFPDRRADFDAALASSLATILDGPAENQGVAVGQAAAQRILSLRRHDGSDATVPYTPGSDPGDWQPTPPAFAPPLAPHWRFVTPFAMTTGSQFRPPAPPALDSAEYTTAFNEVKGLGRIDSATRTEEQTQIAKFWNDGLGTAFAQGYWNRIAQTVATEQGLGLVAQARLFGLLNIATVDAGISCWDAKYEYDFWRPVTAIRAADTDGNDDTAADATWSPLLITPPFPSYTSAHSTVSAAAAGVLSALFGPNYQFTVTADSQPGMTRSFSRFDAAAAEAGLSRIYGGIHYSFDNTAAQAAGARLGEYVANGFMKPQDDDGDDPLLAAAAPHVPVNETLRSDQVQPLLAEALAHWQAAGADTSALHGIDIRIADLGGLTLGRASDGVIWIDDNAAGWGWFVDATPGDDSEFLAPGDQGEQNRMDLLSVLMHEVGHVLGHEHDEGGVMNETLAAGTRQGFGGDAIPAPESDAVFVLLALEEGPTGMGSKRQ